MANFIAKVVDQKDHPDGRIIVVEVTGFGEAEGPLMTRAKARAVASSPFGKDNTTYTRTVDKEKSPFPESEDIFADKSEGLFSGPISGVRDRLKAFRKDGLFAQVMDHKEVMQGPRFKEGSLEDTFGNMADFVNTYRYEILVTTNYSFG